MSHEEFLELGLSYTSRSSSSSPLTINRTFRSFYGVSPDTCSILWRLIKDEIPGIHTKHLLWTLLFLKCYNTESVNAAIVQADEKTFRLWVWKVIDGLASLKVVIWENRLKNVAPNTNIFVTIDGTDFRIEEPKPFNRKWYSHKFKSAGIRYEIGIAIKSGDIVWASGGFPCGAWPDLKIARDLYCDIAQNEITLADKGYRDAQFFKQAENATENRLLARHETVNGRLKNFNILNNRFRHPLQKHPKVFHACVNIQQILINQGEKLFD